MTEAEWLACPDRESVFAAHARGLSDRKRILFCVQCCRQNPSVASNEKRPRSLTERWDLTEQFADGEVDLQRVRRKWGYTPRVPGLSWPERAEEWVGVFIRQEDATVPYPPDESIVRLLRDIFGNPFRPVTVKRSWLTPRVLDLASTMYESRRFNPMPTLADLLEEAGCDDADILAHCRGGGPHVRGCWVVDLVLGKG